MNMRVIRKRVLIEIEEQQRESAGGIVLPEARKWRDQIGVVSKCGPEVTTLKPGDRVIYNKYSQLITIDSQQFRLVEEKNVLAVIESADVKVEGANQPLAGSVSDLEYLD